MPFIIMKRDDIPAGTLQVLDLEPNTSLRNLTLDPPGQTKYINAAQNDPVVTRQPGGNGNPILMHREARGLAAWLITNVSVGDGDAAEGTFTIDANNTLLTSATVDASAVGGPDVDFTFVGGAPANSTEVQIGADADATASNLADAINNSANGLTPFVTAAAVNNVVTVTAVQEGTAGNDIVLADDGDDITSVTMAGGDDANPLTAANVNTMAADILANVVRFGDLTAAAVAADLAAINGEIQNTVATAAITAAQLPRVLDILAGRHYVAPAGLQIATDENAWSVSPAVGAAGGPGFVEGTLRNLFLGGSLTLSVAGGELATYLDTGFAYRGTTGAQGQAVVVYNDDGTLFTP